MNTLKIGIICLSLSYACNLYAAEKWPEILLYKDKPVDSLCLFEGNEEAEGEVSLAKCGLHAEAARKKTGENPDLIQQGYAGYDYTWEVEDADTQGYSYYKPFAMTGNAAVVLTRNNSGGTGQFSSLILVARNADRLKITAFAGGDRCNNGITDMKLEQDAQGNSYLVYGVNLTAFDFLDLANDNPHHLEAYADLDACAACCKASAIMQRSLDENFAKEKLLYVDLSSYAANAEEASSDIKYQACFDSLFNEYVKKNNSRLNPQALAQFTQRFNTQCVSKK
ncbi:MULTISPECIES: PI-PLC domain-containing protein [Legionella]|uniref:hypothetical protein n=1 Tax=Legionella TaxID=445 RepID=UPI000F8F5E0A|nr:MULTISPECIES: hypothetical protein [Legionella]MCP0914216.1 hypothetical protein [Legionella sp. 27cVA30]RUR00557.1 hypothetical protein ELY11_02030 [Legionella septentrionalis]RUR11758.1 hypothetical protein ELY14_00490 [Legionella septentrionalis]RUR17446.1 hypothetical protein ELY10_00490 [Legionella septentrionalis]